MNETSEEIRARAVGAMGEHLGDVYYLLRNYLVDLHITWLEYRTLFATQPSTVDLLNDLAPTFFARVQTIFWHDVLIGLCRLTDAPEMRGRQNLSILRLPPLVADSEFRREVEAAAELAKARSGFARDWRNRRLAHLDLSHAQDSEAHPLQGASRLSVEDALRALRDLMNLLELKFFDSTTLYEETIIALGNSESLLFWLERARAIKRQGAEPAV